MFRGTRYTSKNFPIVPTYYILASLDETTIFGFIYARVYYYTFFGGVCLCFSVSTTVYESVVYFNIVLLTMYVCVYQHLRWSFECLFVCESLSTLVLYLIFNNRLYQTFFFCVCAIRYGISLFLSVLNSKHWFPLRLCVITFITFLSSLCVSAIVYVGRSCATLCHLSTLTLSTLIICLHLALGRCSWTACVRVCRCLLISSLFLSDFIFISVDVLSLGVPFYVWISLFF